MVVYPLIRGQTPVEYYGTLLPVTATAWQLAHGAAASVLFLSLLFGAWLLADGLRVDVHQPRRRWLRRLLLLPATALLGATASAGE